MEPLRKDAGLSILPNDLASRKKIGRYEGADVYHLRTKGGYNIVAAAKREGTKVLGVGPHPAVARFLAEKSFPGLQITELAKSSWADLSRAEMAAALPEARRILAAVWSAE